MVAQPTNGDYIAVMANKNSKHQPGANSVPSPFGKKAHTGYTKYNREYVKKIQEAKRIASGDNMDQPPKGDYK